jgi:hypothetical protein
MLCGRFSGFTPENSAEKNATDSTDFTGTKSVKSVESVAFWLALAV